jgi:hypothetical protein
VSTPECPFCGGPDAERVGQWGGQIITAQWRCLDCNSYFEAIREDFADDAPARGPQAAVRPRGA